MTDEKEILVIGAGLAGPLLSIFLARRDHHVTILERRPDMRKSEISAGRSINLALSERGIHALRQADVLEAVMAKAIPMKGRLMHAVDGTTTFHRYGQDDSEVIYSVSRARLNRLLMDAADATGKVDILFDEACTAVDLENGTVIHQNRSTGESTVTAAEHVFAADGSGSIIREEMEKHHEAEDSLERLPHGYKELTIPADGEGGFRLEPNALHIWPRGEYMLIALPNSNGTFTCTLFFPMEGDPSFASLNTAKKVRHFFEEVFPDAVPYLDNLESEFFENRTGPLGTVRCWPWHVADRFLLLGDAAHAVVPFFGQGMNAAFEDCTVLDSCLDDGGADWEELFALFSQKRKPDTDAIAEMALENYVEMRSDTAHPEFLLKKKIEFELERRFPDRFIPRYSMVAFHQIPYSECMRRGRIQAEILDELSAGISSTRDINWDNAELLILNSLDSLEGL